MLKLHFYAIAVLTVVSLAVSAAKLEPKTAVDPNGYRYNYVENDPYCGREYTLKNGLKVYLSRIPVQPRISFKLAVRAGLADSPPEATGLAHYLEHMLFKGGDRIGALDHEKEKVLLGKIEQLFEQRRKTADPKEKERIYAEIDRLSGEAAKLAAAGEYIQLHLPDRTFLPLGRRLPLHRGRVRGTPEARHLHGVLHHRR